MFETNGTFHLSFQVRLAPLWIMRHLWDKWDMEFIKLEKGQNGDRGDISHHTKESVAKGSWRRIIIICGISANRTFETAGIDAWQKNKRALKPSPMTRRRETRNTTRVKSRLLLIQ